MSTQVPIEHYNKRAFKTGEVVSTMTDELIGRSNDRDSSKKVRRAFSMPRNPFRWSRKFKTSKEERSVANDSSGKINEIHQVISEVENNSQTISSPHSRQPQQQYRGDNNIASAASRVLRRPSFRKFLSRIAQHVTSVNIGANKHSTTSNLPDRVPPISGYQWPPDHTPGVTGLKNHGNTCFMNAVLQCLSHTDILAEYFVLDQYKADLKRRNKLNSRKFGTKGELTEQLANVLKALWTCKNETDHSTSFKAVVDRYGTQFRSSTQHDAQEFLFWLLDKVHEDLNTATKRRYKTIKNNYGRPDEVIAAETLANHIRCNNSFVQAVFQAQFRSSLTCPRCKKQSNTFDPFHCISVQLPQLSQQVIFVTVLYVTQHPRQVKLGLTVPPGSPIIALREQLHADTGISVNRMVLADINDTGFSRVFYDSQPISTLERIDSIYCIEIPEIKEDNTSCLMLLIANVKKNEDGTIKRFGTPFCVQVNRDCNYVELQKKLLKEMSAILKPEVFAYTTPFSEMFQIRLQDPSADPDTYLEQVEHPLFMEIIDMALSVLSADAGPAHIKLLLEWPNPDQFFADISDPIVEHESVSQFSDNKRDHQTLTLEQCLEHYTKAETLSAEDAWRCPNCQQYLPVVKTLGLWSLPDILVIHFKRFRQQHEKGPDAAKLTTMVKFPLHSFDMSPHLARESSSNDSLNNDEHGRNIGSPWRRTRDHGRYKEKELKDNRYDLYAVCYHQGDTLETGHYTAACKNPYDHQWYKFDDQRVTLVPTDKIPEQIINNEAYILFYQRRKVDNSECSGTSSTSGDHWVSKIASSFQGGSSCNSSGIVGVNVCTTLEKQEKVNDEDILTNPPIFEKVSNFKNKVNEVVIEKPNENEPIEVEGLEIKGDMKVAEVVEICETKMDSSPQTSMESKNDVQEMKDTVDIKTPLKTIIQKRQSAPISSQSNTLSPVKPCSSGYEPNLSQRLYNGMDFKEALSSSLRSDSSNKCVNLRHSFSTSSGYKFKDCDAISMLRNTAHSCSKDTLIFIDQQSHSLMEENDSFLGSRSLWISPVTPHKLITVSPKN